MEPKRIVFAEDHSLISEMWGELIKNTGEFVILAKTKSVKESLHSVASLQPDLLILDVMLSDGSAIDSIETFRQSSPATRILVLSGNAELHTIKKAFGKGANGYITKTAGYEEIMKAISLVLDGKSYMSYDVQQKITNQFTDTGNSIELLLNTLTKQEIKICRFIYKGLSSKEVAEELSISVKTVQIHRHNIYKKLNIHKLSQLMLLVQDHQSFFDTE
ncbi:MAG: response regulator transcription factor [Lacibacter sp.]|jgi:DNA-binding NarL/FixJ family response regulator